MPADTPDPALVARLRAAGCVFAEDEAALLRAATSSPDDLEKLVVRRVAGEPLELVLGWAEIGGVRVRTAPGVFVPRQRSQLLVRLALDHLASCEPQRGNGATLRFTILDLGCGTGALGALVAARAPGAEVWATDIDPAAVGCARLNLPPERVLLGDLFAPLPPDLRFDVILANAPYVPTAEIAHMPPEARDHEHHVALDGGADGLDVQRRAIAAAPQRLLPGGLLLVETGRAQAATTAALMRTSGLSPATHHNDDLYATAVSGVLSKTGEGPPPPR